MDYREAIKEAESQIDMYEAFILYNNDFEPKNDNSNYEFKMEFLKTAISAMQELQMYKDNRLCLIPDNVYKRQCEELDEYKKLGTLEELKELRAYKEKMEMQYLDDIGNPLEPLKLKSALESEIMKYEFRKKNNPKQISTLDYTIMFALKHCLEDVLEVGE